MLCSVKYRSLSVSLTDSWHRLLQDASCLILTPQRKTLAGRGRNVTLLSAIAGQQRSQVMSMFLDGSLRRYRSVKPGMATRYAQEETVPSERRSGGVHKLLHENDGSIGRRCYLWNTIWKECYADTRKKARWAEMPERDACRVAQACFPRDGPSHE